MKNHNNENHVKFFNHKPVGILDFWAGLKKKNRTDTRLFGSCY